MHLARPFTLPHDGRPTHPRFRQFTMCADGTSSQVRAKREVGRGLLRGVQPSRRLRRTSALPPRCFGRNVCMAPPLHSAADVEVENSSMSVMQTRLRFERSREMERYFTRPLDEARHAESRGALASTVVAQSHRHGDAPPAHTHPSEAREEIGAPASGPSVRSTRRGRLDDKTNTLREP